MHIKNSDLKIIADALRDGKFSPRTQWTIESAMLTIATVAWFTILV